MKYLFIPFLFFVLLNGYSQKADASLSLQMYNCQSKNDSLKINHGTFNDRNKEYVLYQERCSLFESDTLSNILASDTLFFIESYCKGFIEGQVWTERGERISYTKNANDTKSRFNFLANSLFPDKLVSLVSLWKVEEIRREIEKREVIIIPTTYCYLTRIIKYGNKINSLECLSFISTF